MSISKLAIKAFVFISVFTFLFSSCKEDSIIPDAAYVGTWVGTYSSSILGITVDYKETRTLTNSTFVSLTQLYDSTSAKWIDYMRMAGTLSTVSDTMNFKLTEFGISAYDTELKRFTGLVTTYKEGTSGFENLCLSMNHPKTFFYLFNVSGNKLISKLDLNDDGDFNDKFEYLELTKQ
jgi:hypothetical protein